MTEKTNKRERELYETVATIIEQARGNVARSVNTAMVHAYWHIGREIVEVEQQGDERADYGAGLINRLSKKLVDRYGKGFSPRTLRRVRRFYLSFPHGSMSISELGEEEIWPAVLSKSDSEEFRGFPALLSWTHYLALVKIPGDEARAFYEIECAQEGWSTRELERQIGSMLFERLAKSRDKAGVRAMASEGLQVSKPADVMKDPLVLEFLELQERRHWQERDLEQALIDKLEMFLLELGKGFCFVGRQKRITIDGDHFYIDLVFYNRLLQCFVLVDLKTGKLTHQDLGQMQMYVNYHDRYVREEHEAPTVGIVLCLEKNDAVVRITLPEDNERILASTYKLHLPTEEQLRTKLLLEKESLENTPRPETEG